jgi:hypothetical protein
LLLLLLLLLLRGRRPELLLRGRRLELLLVLLHLQDLDELQLIQCRHRR